LTTGGALNDTPDMPFPLEVGVFLGAGLGAPETEPAVVGFFGLSKTLSSASNASKADFKSGSFDITKITKIFHSAPSFCGHHFLVEFCKPFYLHSQIKLFEKTTKSHFQN
jgi:hypothetical protein